MKKIVILIAIMVCFWCVCGCKSGETENIDKIYGTWNRIEEGLSITYTFNTDGTYTEYAKSLEVLEYTSNDNGTYEFDGKNIELYSEGYDYGYSYKVTFDGDTMVWDNDMTQLTYIKQE